MSEDVDKDSFRVRFVGEASDLMCSYAEFYSCHDIVETLPQMSHENAISFLKQATCLLFPNRGYIISRRTPEYMAARKPVLGFPWYDASASQKILEKYGAAFIARDSQEIATTLNRMVSGVQSREEYVGSYSGGAGAVLQSQQPGIGAARGLRSSS
jgi:hypothetical protein